MKLKLGDVEKEVERVQVSSSGEPWSEHLLEDGHVVRARLVVTAVYKIVGETDPLGRPVYQVMTHTVFDIQ